MRALRRQMEEYAQEDLEAMDGHFNGIEWLPGGAMDGPETGAQLVKMGYVTSAEQEAERVRESREQKVMELTKFTAERVMLANFADQRRDVLEPPPRDDVPRYEEYVAEQQQKEKARKAASQQRLVAPRDAGGQGASSSEPEDRGKKRWKKGEKTRGPAEAPERSSKDA